MLLVFLFVLLRVSALVSFPLSVQNNPVARAVDVVVAVPEWFSLKTFEFVPMPKWFSLKTFECCVVAVHIIFKRG